MGIRRVVAIAVIFGYVGLARTQVVQEIETVGVSGQDKCFQCCTDLKKEDATLLTAACQTGCDNNLGGIDQTQAAQEDAFNAGSNFNRIGTTLFNGNTYFCSPAGSVQQVFPGQIGQNDCQICCSSLNNQFDVNGEFNVNQCVAACVDGFADDCADLDGADNQDGCAIGVLFKEQIGANFFNTDHFCSNVGVLSSYQAIQVSLINNAGVVQDNECSLCCDALADETNIGAADCSLGCNPTVVCEDDAGVEADCDIGVSLATTSIAQIPGGSEITCLSPGVVERFINLDDLAIELNDDEILTAVGATVGYAALIALLAFAVYRRRTRSKKSSHIERGILDGENETFGARFMSGMSTNFKSMAQGFGGMFSTFRGPQQGFIGGGGTMNRFEMEESIGSPGRGGPEAAPPGKGKGGFLGRFRREKRANANSAIPSPRYDQPKQKRRGLFGRFRKKPEASRTQKVDYKNDRFNGYGQQSDRYGYDDDFGRDYKYEDKRSEAYGPVGGASPRGGRPPRGGPPPMGGKPPARGPRGYREDDGSREPRRGRDRDRGGDYNDQREPRYGRDRGRDRDGGQGRRRDGPRRQRGARDRGDGEGGQRRKRKKRRGEDPYNPEPSSKLRVFSNQ